MKTEFPKRRIDTLGRIITGKTPKTSEPGNFGGRYPFITIPDLGSAALVRQTERTLSEEGANCIKTSRLPAGAIMMSCIATVGKCGITTCESFTNQQINTLIPSEGANPTFIYYAFLLLKDDLETSGSGGATYTNVSKSRFGELEIPYPPIKDQDGIAATLGALDDKIEVNRRMAATLEEMARALYRSWFVDFDPVTARAQGRAPAHMDPATAALFPARLTDAGLPEGWEWHSFEDFYAVLETGKRPKGGISGVSEGIPSIGAESIKNLGSFDFGKTKLVPREFFEAMKKGRVSEGDILIYKDGGKPGELRPAATYVSGDFPFKEACINEHVFRVRLNEDLGQHFGFLALSSDHCMNQMRELATGVAQPGLNQSAMKALSFLMPANPELLKTFGRFAQPLLDGCNEKAKESRTLATLRDALLPKLMSGELRVRETERQVAEAV